VATPEKPVSQAQLDFIKSLMSQKDLHALDAKQQEWLVTADFTKLTTKQASRVIKALMDLPRNKAVTHGGVAPVSVTDDTPYDGQQPVEAPIGADTVKSIELPTEDKTIPDAGYYFIVDPTDNTEKFFRVQKGKPDTRWEGYTFLAVQASDVFYPIKNAEHRNRVFEAILLDPVNAMNEYGMRLGRCGVCNRILTARHSRLRGIGPICAERFDMVSHEDMDLLTQLGLIGSETDSD